MTLMRSLLLFAFVVPPFALVGMATPAGAEQEEAAPQNDWMVHTDRTTGTWRVIPERPNLVLNGTVQLMVLGPGRFSIVLDDDSSIQADISSTNGTLRTAELAAPIMPGDYPFHDKYHPEARGILVVRTPQDRDEPPTIGVIPDGYESGFAPARLEVSTGASVRFTANGTSGHSLQASNGGFGAGDLSPGEEATFEAPTTPGEYQFECRFHKEQGMVGVLVVSAASAPATGEAGQPGASAPSGGNNVASLAVAGILGTIALFALTLRTRGSP